jgi:hypothetical protein
MVIRNRRIPWKKLGQHKLARRRSRGRGRRQVRRWSRRRCRKLVRQWWRNGERPRQRIRDDILHPRDMANIRSKFGDDGQMTGLSGRDGFGNTMQGGHERLVIRKQGKKATL